MNSDMNSDDLDIVFHALAHRDRRRILELVRTIAYLDHVKPDNCA